MFVIFMLFVIIFLKCMKNSHKYKAKKNKKKLKRKEKISSILMGAFSVK